MGLAGSLLAAFARQIDLHLSMRQREAVRLFGITLALIGFGTAWFVANQ